MSDILEDLENLHKQATVERSHYYTGGVVRRAMEEIAKLRSPRVVTDAMFDEAVKVGSQSATMANRYMTIARDLLQAIDDATDLLTIGKTEEASDMLTKAMAAAARKML